MAGRAISGGEASEEEGGCESKELHFEIVGDAVKMIELVCIYVFMLVDEIGRAFFEVILGEFILIA